MLREADICTSSRMPRSSQRACRAQKCLSEIKRHNIAPPILRRAFTISIAQETHTHTFPAPSHCSKMSSRSLFDLRVWLRKTERQKNKARGCNKRRYRSWRLNGKQALTISFPLRKCCIVGGAKSTHQFSQFGIVSHL